MAELIEVRLTLDVNGWHRSISTISDLKETDKTFSKKGTRIDKSKVNNPDIGIIRNATLRYSLTSYCLRDEINEEFTKMHEMISKDVEYSKERINEFLENYKKDYTDNVLKNRDDRIY